ncbi:MAG: hypothetical protein ACYS9X_26200 [Planctomycetota bacterium]|jgi:hypothetical protein
MRVLKLIALLVLAAALPEVGLAGATRVECKDGKHSYWLLLPPSYQTDKDRKFPVLFSNSPGAGGDFYGMQGWAARNEVILVALNDTKNGMERKVYDDAYAAVIGSVEETLRVHPCLRFSIGMSGGASMSMRMAGAYSNKFAGVILLAHSGNGADAGLAKHIMVGFIHAENDKIHGAGAVRSVAGALKGRRHMVREICGNWGHTNGPLEHREEFMDWMLSTSRLMHPRLPPAERKAAVADIKKRIKALPEIANPGARLREAETLLAIPGVARWPDARTLLAGWFSAKYDAACAIEDAVDRFHTLADLSEDPQVARCSSSDRRKLRSELTRLCAKSPVSEESKARKMYARIAQFEKTAGKNKGKLLQAARSYAMLAKKYPTTGYGRKAGVDARRLEGELK